MHSFRPTFLEIDTLNSKLIKEKNCTQKPLELQKSKNCIEWETYLESNQIKIRYIKKYKYEL